MIIFITVATVVVVRENKTVACFYKKTELITIYFLFKQTHHKSDPGDCYGFYTHLAVPPTCAS